VASDQSLRQGPRISTCVRGGTWGSESWDLEVLLNRCSCLFLNDVRRCEIKAQFSDHGHPLH
jgi:hypothetical protein